MQNIFIWASNALVFSSYLAYEWAMLKGKAKPHRTTRLVLFIIVVLGFFSMYAQGDRVVVWFLGICSVQSLIMLLMSIKYGMGGWAKEDLLALFIAIVGIVTWKITDNPSLGLYAAVIADFAGMVPALIKTYKFPKTEYWLTYVFDLAAILLTGLAIQNGGFNDYLYPVYLFSVNGLMMILLLRKSST
jgi:hypothetical protein